MPLHTERNALSESQMEISSSLVAQRCRKALKKQEFFELLIVRNCSLLFSTFTQETLKDLYGLCISAG